MRVETKSGYFEKGRKASKIKNIAWVQLATRIPEKLHTNLKLHCIEQETSIQDFIILALEEVLAKNSKKRRAA